MNHTYEELRNATVGILSKRTPVGEFPDQLSKLQSQVNELLILQQKPTIDRSQNPITGTNYHYLEPADLETIAEVFWDLFRQAVITPGLDHQSNSFPWFRISSFGKKLLDEQDNYFFHDTSSYVELLEKEIPNLNAITLLYLKECMQAFKVGCFLSSSVMLGVATEHTFNLLLEEAAANPKYERQFKKAAKERHIQPRVELFKEAMTSDLSSMPKTTREDIETNFTGVLSAIRINRNNSGHPSGQIPNREQCYVLLSLFTSYGKKMYQLMEFYKQ